MRRLVDLLYLIAAIVSLPFWLPRMIATDKVRTDWRGRFGRVGPATPADDSRPTILIHAVSVGEVNATRRLVEILAADKSRPCIVLSTTTDTGVARATALYADTHSVVRYPFDFSFSVSRFIDAVRPDVVALMELEVWPNFTAICAKRGIPVGIINGRISQRSASRYNLVLPLVRASFKRLAFAAMQTQTYADRVRALGAPADRVRVTDTMKWDTAEIEDQVPGADQLAAELGVDRSRPLVVAGSTAPEEHELLHRAVPDSVQLLCAPRKPEWFDDAARALPGCARRSKGDRGSGTGRFLLDSIGELRQAYALADVVIVGRTFVPGQYGGSDMMEPVALGKATIVGPEVRNFQDTVHALLQGGGLIQCHADHLAEALQRLLDAPQVRNELGEKGRDVIRRHQGASARHAEIILGMLRATDGS